MTSPRERDPDSLRQQAALYGAPIGDSVQRVTSVLGLSQAAVARTLGVSPPMLSQLVGGQRVKLGSPLAVQRLQSLLDLADQVEGGLPHDRVASRVAAIGAEESTTLTSRRREAASEPDPAEVVRRVLTAVASRRELAEAADLLDQRFPAVSGLLRACAGGSDEEVRTRLAPVRDLL